MRLVSSCFAFAALCGVATYHSFFFSPPSCVFWFRLCLRYSKQMPDMVVYPPNLWSTTIQDVYPSSFISESIRKELLQYRCSSQPKFMPIYSRISFPTISIGARLLGKLLKIDVHMSANTPGNCSPPATPGCSLISPTMHTMPTKPGLSSSRLGACFYF